jgi:hypothetical protein
MKLWATLVFISGLPAMAADRAASAADPAACNPPPAVQRPVPAGDAGEGYWTPERLRNAQPREVHPTGPMEPTSAVPPCPPESTGAPGSPGSGEVEPDPNRVIIPMAPDGGG